MSLSDKINYLEETKNQIKTAIQNKGVTVIDSDSFRSYANKINQIEVGGETSSNTDWQPEPDWWDIRKILEEDTENYSQKIICLLTDELDDGATTNKVSGGVKYKLSDGQVIQKSSDLDISNLFDISKDKICAKGYKTRYIIYYSNNSSAIDLPNNAIYAILDGFVFRGNFSNKRYLQCIDFINGSKTGSSYGGSMFLSCSSLQKVTGLDLSDITDVSTMFRDCVSLKEVSMTNTNQITNMMGMFKNCYSLQKVTGLNTNNTQNMLEMFYSCASLKQISNLDMSSVTNMGDMLYNCYSLATIKSLTVITDNLNLRSSSLLTHTTLLTILNALSDKTGQTTKTLTLGSTNLAKLTDEEKAIATNKNWTLG